MSFPATIAIENVYYMLAYAFKAVSMDEFKKVSVEEFDNVDDLLAAILVVGLNKQIRAGFYRTYETEVDDITTLRGRLCFPQTIRNLQAKRQRLVCEFDDFSIDNLFNRILRTTIQILLHAERVKAPRRNALKKILPFLASVSVVAPKEIRWDMLRYQRNNKSYVILMNLCRLVVDGYLMGDKDGSGACRLKLFDEEKLSDVYEGFLREYYLLHHPEIEVPGKKCLCWDASPSDQLRLPRMETDVMLRARNKVLIIDAKFYGNILQYHFGSSSYHNSNLYQINTYVTSAKADPSYAGDEIVGMLLYAQTTERVPSDRFTISGNLIHIETLDLNQKFSQISAKLDAIVTQWNK